MGMHAVIIDPSTATNDTAFLDLTAEPLGNGNSYVVYPVGLAPLNLGGTPVANNFCTSAQDLIAAASGRLALVVCTTDNPALQSHAVLRQGKLILAVPSLDKVGGRVFAFPLGDLGTGTTLYVGTPNGAPATVQVSYGSLGAPGGSFSVDSSTVNSMALTQAQTRVVVNVTSAGPVLCQVIIRGHGREADAFLVWPLT
jgi:hypothetical protein